MNLQHDPLHIQAALKMIDIFHYSAVTGPDQLTAALFLPLCYRRSDTLFIQEH